jgi:hypothetical protein
LYNSGDVPKVDTQPKGESSREIQVERGVTGEPDVYIDKNSDKIVTEALGNTPGRLLYRPQISKKPALIDEIPLTYVTE